jgi:phosphohistidine phosphatase
LRHLLLLRHAKSMWDDPKLSDHARPLNARGKASARAVGEAMRARGLNPDLVLVSSARRTLQTLEALQPWSRTPLVEPMDALYLASASAMLDVLHLVTERMATVLVIAHNPGLHELAMVLVGAQGFTQSSGAEAALLDRLAQGFPTGAMCEFSVTGPWTTLGEGGGKLLRFTTPNDMPGDLPGANA